ncbi:MAG: ABC transporter permease subunit [Flavobacteriales bacterium]|nr:ABC transporter permease subunit [Flavobacteriales bacterium]
MLALILKEVRGFLGSLIGHIVIAVFLLLTGLFLWVFPNNILDSGYADLGPLFFIAPWVFLFLVPAVTMRSFSEEKRTGTIEVLLTKPLTELQIVLAKYLASVLLIVVALIPTLVYVWSVDQLSTSVTAVPVEQVNVRWIVFFVLAIANAIGSIVWLVRRGRKRQWNMMGWIIRAVIVLAWIGLFAIVLNWMLFIGGIDAGGTWGSYLGLFFLAACFAAVGVFASSITDSQIVAFLIAVFLCFFLYMGFDLIASFDVMGGLEGPIKAIGIQDHYASMSRGVIDLGDVLYHLGAIVIFLLLTRTALQSRTW